MLGPPGSNAKSGGVSTGWFEGIECGCNPPQHGRLSGRAGERFLGERDQVLGMERRGQALQTQRGHFPIAVAACAAKQAELATRAFDERGAQLAKKLRIIAGCHSEMGIDCVTEVSHTQQISVTG